MEIDVRNEGAVSVFVVSGMIDTITCVDLQKSVFSAIEQGTHQIVIDMANVTYVSSAGLRVFLLAQKALKPHGESVVIRNISQPLKTIFDVSGFSDLFEFA